VALVLLESPAAQVIANHRNTEGGSTVSLWRVPRRDVACPWLCCDLGVALGDVVAKAEKLCDKGRRDFYGQAL